MDKELKPQQQLQVLHQVKTLLLQLVQMLVLLVKKNLQQMLKVLPLLILTVKKQVKLLVRVQSLALLLEQAVQKMKKSQPKEKKKLV